jgi:7-carboxy-7-deazaguanine synthase
MAGLINSRTRSTDPIQPEGAFLPLMEEFYTIQGEGFHAGKAAYFVRIGGCDVGCHWCDVKESWNELDHPLTAVSKIVENASKFPAKAVVITGGEPCISNLSHLTGQLKKKEILTFLETSGAYTITGEWDWICLSPKKTMPALEQNFSKADELKVIIHNKDDFRWAEESAFKISSFFLKEQTRKVKLYLQPEWSRRNEMLPLIVNYVQQNPQWMISLQTHKYIGIP